MAITKATASAVAPAAKGDLVVGSATNDAAVLGVGTNGQLLTADSTTGTGLKWADAPASGLTQLATGSLSSGTTTINSFSSSYRDLVLEIYDYVNTVDDYALRINGDSTTNYYGHTNVSGGSISGGTSTRFIIYGYSNTGSVGFARMYIPNYNFSTRPKMIYGWQVSNSPNRDNYQMCRYTGTSAVTSLTLFPISGTVTNGTYVLYGAN